MVWFLYVYKFVSEKYLSMKYFSFESFVMPCLRQFSFYIIHYIGILIHCTLTPSHTHAYMHSACVIHRGLEDSGFRGGLVIVNHYLSRKRAVLLKSFPKPHRDESIDKTSHMKHHHPLAQREH